MKNQKKIESMRKLTKACEQAKLDGRTKKVIINPHDGSRKDV